MANQGPKPFINARAATALFTVAYILSNSHLTFLGSVEETTFNSSWMNGGNFQ